MKVSKITAVGGLGGDKPTAKKTTNSYPDEHLKDVPRTRPIKHIQTGVTDGKTGKQSMYVYTKTPDEKGFDVAKHRETVYMENMPTLQKTVEYQNYRRGLASKK